MVVSITIPGSSPHTRGALEDGYLFEVEVGIIPAYAGSTRARGPNPMTRRDHPRIRGEHGKFIERIKKGAGSSPHTRGALALYLL